MTPTSAIERIDRKLQQLRRLEASYRQEIRRAEEEYRRTTLDKDRALKRLEKIRTNYARRINRVMPKIRGLLLRRAELKA